MNQENLVDISMLGTFTVAYRGRSVQESRCKDALPWQLMKYLAANHPRKISKDELVYGLCDPRPPAPSAREPERDWSRKLPEGIGPLCG